jgi:hypothetical protein
MGSAAAPRALSGGKCKLENGNQKSEIRNQKSEIRLNLPVQLFENCKLKTKNLKLRTENELSCPQAGDRVPIVLN